MRQFSAEARLHLYARAHSLGRASARSYLIAFYGALAVIAAIVLGTFSVHPF